MDQLNPVFRHVSAKRRSPAQSRCIPKRPHRQRKHRDSIAPQFIKANAFCVKRRDMRFEARSIERARRLGKLPLAAAKIELSARKQHRDGLQEAALHWAGPLRGNTARSPAATISM